MMHYAGILNFPVSRKSSRTCLLAIWNVKEGWQEGKQTDFESLFHLVSFVSFLLLWGVGLMLPFYRWGSERSSESLRATQLVRGAAAWVLAGWFQTVSVLQVWSWWCQLRDGNKHPWEAFQDDKAQTGSLTSTLCCLCLFFCLHWLPQVSHFSPWLSPSALLLVPCPFFICLSISLPWFLISKPASS